MRPVVSSVIVFAMAFAMPVPAVNSIGGAAIAVGGAPGTTNSTSASGLLCTKSEASIGTP